MYKSSDFKPFKNYEIVYKNFEVENKISEFERFMNYINRIKKIEKINIREDFDYSGVSGLSHEIKEKLSRFRPRSLGQASRVSGVTPAAISLLMVKVHSEKGNKK